MREIRFANDGRNRARLDCMRVEARPQWKATASPIGTYCSLLRRLVASFCAPDRALAAHRSHVGRDDDCRDSLREFDAIDDHPYLDRLSRALRGDAGPLATVLARDDGDRDTLNANDAMLGDCG